MEKVLILYSSMTYNTEDAATALQTHLSTTMPGKTFTLLNVRDATAASMTEYQVIIFGSSTWDDENNPDTEAFFAMLKVSPPNLSTQKIALFGLGDSSYPDFCGAMPVIKKNLEAYGATVYETIFTIDGYPTDNLLSGLFEWATTYLTTLTSSVHS